MYERKVIVKQRALTSDLTRRPKLTLRSPDECIKCIREIMMQSGSLCPV